MADGGDPEPWRAARRALGAAAAAAASRDARDARDAGRPSRRRLLALGWRAPSARFGADDSALRAPGAAQRGGDVAVRRVFLSAAATRKLVDACEAGAGPGPRVTRHDALAAWVWRSLARAYSSGEAARVVDRGGGDGSKVEFSLHDVVDARHRAGVGGARAVGNATATVCGAAALDDVCRASLGALARRRRAGPRLQVL